MSLISARMQQAITGGSMIRMMFEAGLKLKQQFGEEAVCDFSLGNPDLPPPATVTTGLKRAIEAAAKPFGLGYMPNGGHAWAREALAAHLSRQQGVTLTAADVILTSGAAGALNDMLHSVLEPNDRVLSFRPCFVEYGTYARMHGGVFDTVPTMPDTFAPDLDALEAAIDATVRVLIINNPNNPTGAVYTREQLQGICAILDRKSEEFGRPIFLISDEPYRFLAFDGVEIPSVLSMYRYAVVASSFSKDLCIPGERVGYLAMSPLMEGRSELMAALTFSNRVLGFINTPVVGQYIMMDALGSTVDVEVYKRRRDMLAEILTDAGYEFMLPKGTFYMFPKAPGGDDKAFVQKNLLAQNLLAVPGSAFYGPGYFRLAFCVQEDVIVRSAEKFKAALH